MTHHIKTKPHFTVRFLHKHHLVFGLKRGSLYPALSDDLIMFQHKMLVEIPAGPAPMLCLATCYITINVKNMHLHRDSNPGPWNTIPML